ncbi:RICIN domain-containing protein [Micromonospora sp. NPDC007208]|uniref:RICIN domain-containing protein n=1 Tax=Micromonospora sp. NPDC007208 TaxID=3364236 RepID=UPI0036B6B6DC
MKKRAKLRRVWHRLLATRRGHAEMGALGLSVSSKDKLWKSASSPRPGYVTNAYDGLKFSRAEAAPLRLFAARPGRQWKLRDVGGGTVWIANRSSGKVVGIDGADQAPSGRNSTWNGVPVNRSGKLTAPQDQRRRLLGS